MTDPKPIHAVIGVRRDGASTWYVKRSDLMSNYKGAWSLPSIKFDPATVDDPTDPVEMQAMFEELSEERLGDVGIRVVSYITSGTSDANPMGVDVTLHLFEVEIDEPLLNPRYYVDAEWMDAARFEEAATGQTCGLCTRLWSDFAWLSGITDRPFVAHPVDGAA